MSMVYCRGCGQSIHETAPACPHCGAPQAGPRSANLRPGAATKPQGVMEYYGACLSRKYADFGGRARRTEYWSFALFSSLVAFGLGMIDGLAGTRIDGSTYGILGGLYSLVALIPSLAVYVRRLHDVNKSGWNWLWVLLPIIGWIWLLILLFRDSDAGTNEYGPSPKYQSVGA